MTNEDKKKFTVTIEFTNGTTNPIGQISPDAQSALNSTAEGLEVEIDDQGKVTTDGSDVTRLTVEETPDLPLHHEEQDDEK